VTAGEFGFLGLGLMLGIVSGAALVEILRARPAAAHEVRLTVAHDAVPRRRASTLADDAFSVAGPEPARGGPGDRRNPPGAVPVGTSERRTSVRFAQPNTAVASGSVGGTPGSGAQSAGAPAGGGSASGGVAVGPGPDLPTPGRIMEPAWPLTDAPPTDRRGPHGELVAVPNSIGGDSFFDEMEAAVESSMAGVATETPAPFERTADAPLDAATEAAPEWPRALTTVALLDPPEASGPSTTPGDTERCAEERRVADERCELATRARAQATATADALRVAQRTYDAHEAAAVTASWRADPRAVHEAKESAQGGFRAAVSTAKTPDDLETAARDWLTEINRINTEAREATATANREHAAALAIGATLERLGLESDAARIGAENADAACLSARVVVAECDEATTTDPAAFLLAPAPTRQSFLGQLEEDETLGLALEAGGAPRIFRLLRGDRQAMASLVASLAGNDREDRRRWQLLLTGLVEAIVADAIEAAALEFPEENQFWGSFTPTQDRDIAHALSSLGFRFDGLGGWIDGRYPTQRDLSLALGYAGLDPMRTRHWPTEEAVSELFRDVKVAADEYLAGVAGDLTLAEMVTMLGRRADGLAEVWNQWGRIRPLLLDEA
jgi:hypothetical protein